MAANTPPNASGPAQTPGFWRSFANEAIRVFNLYGHWLARTSWWRFMGLALLLLIVAGLLTSLLETHHTSTISIRDGDDSVHVPAPPAPPAAPTSPKAPEAPTAPKAPKPPTRRDNSGAIVIEKTGKDGRDYSITIGSDGIQITPMSRRAAASGVAASGVARAAAPVASGASDADADADNGDARDEELEQSIERTVEAALRGSENGKRRATRIQERVERRAPPLTQLAMVFILLSAIMKMSYSGMLSAEKRAQVATETAESEQLKRQVVEARMAALQAQVEPHFLFNTLASIDHLIETDPKRASQMQKNLIALLRASMPTLREGQAKAHTLGREMAVIRPYLEILKVRMEDRLQTRIDVPTGLLSAEFPSMMIQSLVENAIKHGLEPKAEGGELAVSAEIVHGKLAVTVADTGLGFGKAATAGTGVGLENMRERLKLIYGDKAAVVVRDNQPSGTVVIITVPYQAQAPEGSAI